MLVRNGNRAVTSSHCNAPAHGRSMAVMSRISTIISGLTHIPSDSQSVARHHCCRATATTASSINPSAPGSPARASAVPRHREGHERHQRKESLSGPLTSKPGKSENAQCEHRDVHKPPEDLASRDGKQENGIKRIAACGKYVNPPHQYGGK